jgi:hypothetical protein
MTRLYAAHVVVCDYSPDIDGGDWPDAEGGLWQWA